MEYEIFLPMGSSPLFREAAECIAENKPEILLNSMYEKYDTLHKLIDAKAIESNTLLIRNMVLGGLLPTTRLSELDTKEQHCFVVAQERNRTLDLIGNICIEHAKKVGDKENLENIVHGMLKRVLRLTDVSIPKNLSEALYQQRQNTNIALVQGIKYINEWKKYYELFKDH